jgi:LmbE family N-acetylglucosaminyl deacetylase
VLNFSLDTARAPRVLFIGAHCDDIEIGCGGTVMQLLRQRPDAEVLWVVLSSNEERAREARRSAAKLLAGVRRKRVEIRDFRESYFPAQMAAIKDYFGEVRRMLDPDIVFAHYRDDLHQDHRVVGELVWNTFRNHPILEYEIPKYDGGMGAPAIFQELPVRVVERKIRLLMQAFPSQAGKAWFTPDTFRGIMRIRGIECNAPEGFAEAFYARKVCFRW